MKTKEICAAADWLAANPVKHITVDLAQNENGRGVSPFDPEATCFCAFGRIMVEVGDEAKAVWDRRYETDDVFEKLGNIVGIRYNDVWIKNDTGGSRGDPRVLDFLREQAKC